uniref:Receptor expression-enhancing protein n=1 Tax=Glossina morsitans morsitans TaxID=37546 RepID=A0A1B0FET2_GLOMM
MIMQRPVESYKFWTIKMNLIHLRAIYGIVLAFWEVLTNVFLWWFPFYYGWKSLTILWLLPTVGDGSSFLYQTFIHPLLQDLS